MNRILAIAANTHREAIRDRVLYSILFFALVVLATALVTEEFSIGDQEKLVRGTAQGSISIFSSIIAIFLGVSLVWRELERKTIYTIVSKPIPRWMFVLGKYLGLLLTLATELAIMATLYVLLLSLRQGLPHWSFLAFIGLLFVELMLLCAWATLFSSYSGPTTATAFTLAVFVIGHVADDIWVFGHQADSPVVRQVASVLYWALPNFEVFNVQPQATHELEVGASLILQATGYGLAYTALVLVASIAVFQRRDFR